MPSNGKTALVTGAASGIGKATATGLARDGYHVVLVVRNAKRGDEATRDLKAAVPGASVEVLACDLSSQASIREAASAFLQRHDKLHVLVNAAGVFRKERHVTPDGLEETFATNYMAYFLLTNLLQDALKRGAPSRVVNVSSRYGGTKLDFDDLQTAKGKYSFMRSTPRTMLARVLFTQAMAERLKGKGVTVNTLHPGLVKNTVLLNDVGGFFRWVTNMLGKPAEVGADTVLWLATSSEVEGVTGKMFANRKEIATPGMGSDPAARQRLWDESVKLAKMA
ncbi:MAG: hypothetical protein QOE90_748 [Thermoplasmata archaeon]|jgi:NAD(P)-dependent dehydrogenase (short-subunit alcohol dehydrogenase family)|nr:hypothetical protein [Thermoplasmata archaeon]